MFKTLIVCGALAALATPAFAGDVAVKLAGKTDSQVTADLHRAAGQVCRDLLQGSVARTTGYTLCVREVVADARSRIPAKTARQAD